MVESKQNIKTRPESGAILVTGGSGFIGRKLVEKLARQDQTVVSMYHHRLPEPMANVYPVCSDLSSVDLLLAPLRGVDTVVHLAWSNNLVGPHGQENWSLSSNQLPANIRYLKNLLQASEKNQVQRFIFVSALGASRQASTPFLREKYLAELLVINSQIPQTLIIRPSLVIDRKSDHLMSIAMQLYQWPLFYAFPYRKKQLKPIQREDFCNRIIQVIEERSWPSQHAIVEMCGSESVTIEQIFRPYFKEFAQKKKWPLPSYLSQLVLPLFERNIKMQDGAYRPRFRDLLAVGHQLNELTERNNPFQRFMVSSSS